MMNFFDEDQTFEKAKEEAFAPKNLTPGRYKLLISTVEVGQHAKGQEFIPSTDSRFVMDDDIEFRFHCVLTDKVGEFPSGWKHTFFFQTKLRDPQDPSKRAVRAKIALGDMQRISEACGMSDWPKDPQQWQGKQFVATFSYGYAKNDTAKEKPFLNLDKVEPAADWAKTPEAVAASTPSVSAPAQNTVNVMPLGSGQPTNTNQPDWR